MSALHCYRARVCVWVCGCVFHSRYFPMSVKLKHKSDVCKSQSHFFSFSSFFFVIAFCVYVFCTRFSFLFTRLPSLASLSFWIRCVVFSTADASSFSNLLLFFCFVYSVVGTHCELRLYAAIASILSLSLSLLPAALFGVLCFRWKFFVQSKSTPKRRKPFWS